MAAFEKFSRIPPAINPITVVYGSETGTAREVAEYVANLARRRGFDARARALDSVPRSQILGSTLAVFIVSTTGDGEVPSNMSVFWRHLLRRGLPGDFLKDMRFAVFGLGDSGYTKYNATARKLHARLLQLGASELVERGLGDDQSPRGMWGDLDPWLILLWQRLLELRPLPEGTVVDDTPRLEASLFAVTPIESPVDNTSPGDWVSRGREALWGSVAPPGGEGHTGGAPASARLMVNRRLTAKDHFQDVRHLEFDVSRVSGGSDYRAGDVAWVHPSNEPSAVERCAALLGLDLDKLLRIELVESVEQFNESALEGLPPVCTTRMLLSEALDILGTPRRSFFEKLSLFALDEEEKNKLEELASPGGSDLLYEYATREKRSYIEVFEDFSSCKLPIERLLELVPRLRPRGFSIASSALVTPSVVHLCVAVVSFRTPYKRICKGVCSSWLASLKPGAKVPLCIRPGTFRLPKSPDHPIIMIAPGTGVAPMRSVILERRRQREALKAEKANGCRQGPSPDTLFFGCRLKEKDFHYRDEWEKLEESGDLLLHTVFSRQDPTGARIYVQRRIRDQAVYVAWLIVEHGAHVLVSGSAKQMPQEVREALRNALAGHLQVGGISGAERLLKSMERRGQYCVEAWS